MLDTLKKYISGFVTLTNEEFALMANELVIRNFDKRELLTRAGEVENYLNFVVKGLVRKYFYKGRTEIITQIAKEGEFVNSSASFLSGNPSPYLVETLEPSTFLSVTRDQLERLYENNPRIERVGRIVITHLFLQREEWEHECLRLDTRERFLRFVENNPDLMQRVPQKYLASYLNMKPETFSRLKHLLQRPRTAAR
ncbi:MAG TPA: Crp/Fnr family transcriptional regulator [Puia sp.]